MASELRFPNIVRTKDGPPSCPREIATVEQAIDCVQELPVMKLQLERWRSASQTLWAAVDAPDDAQKLETAHAGFCAALAAEGWLDDSAH